VILSYSDFISESIFNNAVIFIFNKRGTDDPYRMYYFTDVEEGKRHIKGEHDLDHLPYTINNFQHTSKYLYYVSDQSGFGISHTPYDKLRRDIDGAMIHFLQGVDNMSYPIMYELDDGDYLEFGDFDTMINHNYAYRVLSTNGDDNSSIVIHSNPKLFYPAALKALKEHDYLNDIKKITFEFEDKAERFEESDYYRSLTSGTKYKLFDYASFNESLEDTFKYVLLFSHFNPAEDYLILTNTPHQKPIDDKDWLKTYSKQLERPIRLDEDFYMHISHIDDNTRLLVSLDKGVVVKDFVEQYDILQRMELENQTGYDPKEIKGTVARTNFNGNEKKYADYFMAGSDKKDMVARKDFGVRAVFSYDDLALFDAIDGGVHIETIKNILWNDKKFLEKIAKDPNKEEKYNMVRSLMPINKYKL